MPRWPRGQRPARYAATSARRGLAAHRIPVPDITRYQHRLTGIQLTGGQGQSLIGAGGQGIVQIGPSGLGTVWYPTQATLSTSTGAADASTCQVYLGAQGLATALVGQSYAAGGDTISLAVPALAPGQLLIAVWSSGHPGDTCTINILGLMDCLI